MGTITRSFANLITASGPSALPTTIEVDEIEPQSGTTVTLGDSGDTITIPSGATITVPSGGLSGQNYPAFSVYASDDLAVTTSVYTKVQMNTKILDTDSKFDNVTNYRFTPTIAGKYFIIFSLNSDANTVTSIEQTRAYIYKNGSLITGTFSNSDTRDNFVTSESITTSVIVDLDADDYIEFFGLVNFNTGQSKFQGGACKAQGFRIGT